MTIKRVVCASCLHYQFKCAAYHSTLKQAVMQCKHLIGDILCPCTQGVYQQDHTTSLHMLGYFAGAHTTLAEERIILKDEFLAKFTQGARLKVHDLPDVPKTIQSHITNLLVRYARVFRLFDIRGEPGFPISLVRSCRRGSHSQWVGVACIVHLMVESDNSMTYPYAWHVVERCVQDSESMRDSLNKFRDKTEQGLPLSGSRQTFCKDLADLLADTLPERFGPNHLSYDRGVDVSKEFLDGEISEEYEGVEEDQEGSDNGEE